MAESEEHGERDKDCPLCLEPLPPFWDNARRLQLICCGKEICEDCEDKRAAVLRKAVGDGSVGKAERQLAGYCPMCRAKSPDQNSSAKILLDKFDGGHLQLHLYSNLASKYLDGTGGAVQNVAKGNEILMLGAEKGDPICQCTIGLAYFHGDEGWPKSHEKAKRWLRAAAERGHAIAEYELSQIARDEGNDAECLQYLRGSASKDCNDACHNLGGAYYNGRYGLPQSTKEAIRVVTPAAERGDARSMSLLGFILCNPDQTLPPVCRFLPWEDPRFTKGLQWLRRAAEAGDQNSISNLERMEESWSSVCFRCNKEEPSEKAFLRCSRCRAAWYCSKDCQVQHWKADAGHKRFCIKWK